MPAFVNRRFGESGKRLDDGTMACCFDLKKSRNDWRICVDVIIDTLNHSRKEACELRLNIKFMQSLKRKRAQVFGRSGTSFLDDSFCVCQGRYSKFPEKYFLKKYLLGMIQGAESVSESRALFF